MRFMSTRELRKRPGFVRELARKEDLVLTEDGKPIAVLLGIEGDDLEETALVIRQAKARRAVFRLRQQAARHGGAKASARVIGDEIHSVRRKKTPK